MRYFGSITTISTSLFSSVIHVWNQLTSLLEDHAYRGVGEESVHPREGGRHHPSKHPLGTNPEFLRRYVRSTSFC